jgi:flagellar biosynthesis/type III secretory pathway protein FliH
MTNELSAAEDLVRLLAERLPGFEAKPDSDRNVVQVRGVLKLGVTATYEMFYPAPDSAEFRKRLADEIARGCRELAIKETGLDKLIDEKVNAARAAGVREGMRVGRDAGIKEGRAEGRSEGRAEAMAVVLERLGRESCARLGLES